MKISKDLKLGCHEALKELLPTDSVLHDKAPGHGTPSLDRALSVLPSQGMGVLLLSPPKCMFAANGSSARLLCQQKPSVYQHWVQVTAGQRHPLPTPPLDLRLGQHILVDIDQCDLIIATLPNGRAEPMGQKSSPLA